MIMGTADEIQTFADYTAQAVSYCKARGKAVAVAYKGDYENVGAACQWLSYWHSKGFSGALNAYLRHLEAGKAITVPCLDPVKFDYTYKPGPPRDWRPRHFTPSPSAKRNENANAIRRMMGLPESWPETGE